MNDHLAPQDFGRLVSLGTNGLSALPDIHTEVQNWTTPTGSKVLFVQASHLPMLDVRLRFDTGSADDGDVPGLAALTLDMLDQGTLRFSARQLADEFDALGVQFSKSVRLEHSTLSLRSLSAGELRDRAVDLLTDIVGRPLFESAPLAAIKAQWHATLSQRERHPAFALRKKIFEQLYGEHPYATHYLSATRQGIEQITPQQMRAFHQLGYSAGNLTIALVGDLSRLAAERLALEISHVLPRQTFTRTLATPQPNPAGPAHIESAGANCLVALAMPIDRREEDQLALTVVERILGGGLDSRLAQALRVEHGLSYFVQAGSVRHGLASTLLVEWDAPCAHAQASQALVARIMTDFIETGPTPHELALAQEALANQWLRAVSSNASLVAELTGLGDVEYPAAYLSAQQVALRALTPRTVKAAARRCLDPRRMVVASIGPSVEQQALTGLPDQ